MDAASRSTKRRRTASNSSDEAADAPGQSPSAYPYSSLRGGGSPPMCASSPDASSARFPPPSSSKHAPPTAPSPSSSSARFYPHSSYSRSNEDPYSSARSPHSHPHSHHGSPYPYSPYSSLLNPHPRPPLQGGPSPTDTTIHAQNHSSSRSKGSSYASPAHSPLPVSKASPETPPGPSNGSGRDTVASSAVKDESPIKKETPVEKPRGGQACLECRLAKVRCLPSPDSDSCQRCQRFKFDCLFVQHKRGRKPKSKLQGRDLTLLAEAASATPASAVQPSPSTTTARAEPVTKSASADTHRARQSATGAHVASFSTHERKRKNSRASKSVDESAIDPELMADLASGMAQHPDPNALTPHSRAKFLGADPIYDPKKLSGVDVKRMTMAIQQAMHSQDRRRGAPYTLVTTNENSAVESSESSSERGTPVPPDTNAINESFELIAEQPLTLRVMLKPFEVAHNPNYDTPRTVHDDRITIGAQQRELHLNDPVTTGLLTEPAARALFDLFMAHANAWSEVFDTALQTNDFVRKRSSFLYTVLLYVASRFCRKPTAQHLIARKQRGETVYDSEWNIAYPPASTDRSEEAAEEYARIVRRNLYQQARDHAARAFVDGDRTVACCQAFFILASWKPLDDGLSVIQVGYAFRLAMDIQLHAPMPNCIKPDDSMLDQAGRQRYEAVQRRFRNRQRTFMMLFVQDKSQQIANKISTHSISADNALIRRCQTWWKSQGSVPGDAFVCASVDLRRIQGKYVDLIDRMQQLSHFGDGPSVVLPAFISDLFEWHSRWTNALNLPEDLDDIDDLSDPDVYKRKCQRTTLGLWGNNIKTYVSSLALKYSLKQAAQQEHLELSRMHRRSTTLSTDDRDSASARSSHLLHAPGVVNLMAMPAFWPCVEGARGVLEALNKLPADRLLTMPDATVLQTTHAAVLLCSLATVKAQPPLGVGYLKTTINLIDRTSAAFRRASISPDDTVYHIALYLESLLRPRDAQGGASEAGAPGTAGVNGSNLSGPGSGMAQPLAPSPAPPSIFYSNVGSTTTSGAGAASRNGWQETGGGMDGNNKGTQGGAGHNSLLWNSAGAGGAGGDEFDGGLNAMAAAAASVAAAEAGSGPPTSQQMDIGNLTWPSATSGGGGVPAGGHGPGATGNAWSLSDSFNWNSLLFNQPVVQGQEQTDETLQMLLRFLDG